MDNQIIHIYNYLQEIAWHFGSRGVNGECCRDLSFIEFMALKRINCDSGISIQAIGNLLNFTKSGATRIIDRLEKKGYAVRAISPEDGRVCCVLITEKGKRTIMQITKSYSEYLDDVLMDAGPQKIGEIKEALDVLMSALLRHEPFVMTECCREGKCL